MCAFKIIPKEIIRRRRRTPARLVLFVYNIHGWSFESYITAPSCGTVRQIRLWVTACCTYDDSVKMYDTIR